MNELTLGICQNAGVPGAVDENLEIMEKAIADADERGIELLVFPEGFLTGYYLPELTPESVPETRRAVKRLQRVAASHSVGLVFGLHDVADGQCVNSALAISGDGSIVARYAKRALFGDWERRCFVQGRDTAIFQFGAFRVGVLICYDFEFPELVRELALAGVTLVVVPTALMEPYYPIAKHMVAVRSLENQVFVAYANRCGSEHGLKFVGNSAICGPHGNFIARAGVGDQPLLAARLNLESIKRAVLESCYLEDLERLPATRRPWRPNA